MSSQATGAFARAVVASLAAHGVSDVVLCPGSRSGPLAHALAEADAAQGTLGVPDLRLHVRIDERGAGFLALGMARASGRPVAVITTSGTAVGNLLPAVMEAHHSGVPLICITADRPVELRQVGANQTTNQPGLFGGFVRLAEDVSAALSTVDAERLAPDAVNRALTAAVGATAGGPSHLPGVPGPVHLNLQFRDPLGPIARPWPHYDPVTLPTPARTPDEPLATETLCVVIAGDGAGAAAREVAEAHGWPLLAEPTSGAREGANCIAGYVALLSSPAGKELAQEVRQVVEIGRPTLSREIQALIGSAPRLMVAAHGAPWNEAPRHAERILPAVPPSWRRASTVIEAGPAAAWLKRWTAAGKAAAPKSAAPTPKSWNHQAIATAFLASLGADSTAVLGSSGPIRAVDRAAPAWAVGKAPRLIANRGLAGIDGTVSTAVGVALATPGGASALMGDLTFLHDAGGLLIGPLERRPHLRIVVINDGGGTIFSGLEHASADPERFTRVFTTPHGANIGAVCKAYGAAHTTVRNADALAQALAAPLAGVEVIEAVVKP